MKDVYKETLPVCDICKKEEAIYDAPYAHGPWAFQCSGCMTDHVPTSIGFKLVKGEEPVMSDTNRIAGIHEAMNKWDMDTLMELVGDGDITEYI